MLLKLNKTESMSWSLLGIGSISFLDEKAVAILNFSKDRLADLFELNIDYRIKAAVIDRLSRSAFSSLSEALLLRELSSPADAYRVSIVKRCLQCLPKKTLSNLLSKYLEKDEGSYYNVIHWLDLGVSMPSAIVTRVSLEG